MNLYHVTFIHALDAIARRGLSPSQRSNYGGGYQGHSQGRVFLSDWESVPTWMHKAEYIALDQTDNPEEGWTPVVLRVDSRILSLQDDELGNRDARGKNYFVDRVIPPKMIQVWDGSGWRPVGSVDPEALNQKAKEAADYEEDEGSGWYEMDFEVFMPKRKASLRNVLSRRIRQVRQTLAKRIIARSLLADSKPAAPYLYPGVEEKAPPGVQREIQNFRKLPTEERAHISLWSWLLGDGTPPFKQSKAEAAYTEKSLYGQKCGNCLRSYVHVSSDTYICDAMRGVINPEGWCHLWENPIPVEEYRKYQERE